MKNILKIIPIAILMFACGKPSDEAIKKKIQAKKNNIVRFEQQIADLEKQLSDTSDNIRLIPVEVKNMQPEEFNHYIIVYGKVEADNYALISPEMGGQIKTIHVSEGQTVNKDELLVSLNTSAIEGQIRAIESSLELAKSTFQKQEALFNQGIGSEIEYLSSKSQKQSLQAQLDALYAQKRMAQIRAPFRGTVNKVYPKVGELASPGFPVLEFVNLSEITILADISENYIGMVKQGDVVEVSFSSLPGVKRQVKITRASKVINNISRTFEIELKLSNADGMIKPNMVSTIHINDYTNNEAFIIPSLAIRRDISGNYVYLVKITEGQETVAKNYIETSKSYQEKTLVSKGINAGDKVITKGFHMVSTGIPVQIVN